MSMKKALPIIAIGGGVTAAALYAGSQVLTRYPQKTKGMNAALAAGAGLAGGVIAAMFAGPAAGILVAATLGSVAIATALAPAPAATTTPPPANTSGYGPLGVILSDNLRGYNQLTSSRIPRMGTVLSDNLRGIGAANHARTAAINDAETQAIMKDLGPRY